MKLKILSFIFLSMFLFNFAVASEYQLKQVSELKPGDIIVDSSGNEILVEKIERQGIVQQIFRYEESDSLMNVLWGKIAGRNLPDPVVSGGNDPVGLSLGQLGVGIVITGDVVAELPQPVQEQRNGFLNKMRFWRR